MIYTSNRLWSTKISDEKSRVERKNVKVGVFNNGISYVNYLCTRSHEPCGWHLIKVTYFPKKGDKPEPLNPQGEGGL